MLAEVSASDKAAPYDPLTEGWTALEVGGRVFWTPATAAATAAFAAATGMTCFLEVPYNLVVASTSRVT